MSLISLRNPWQGLLKLQVGDKTLRAQTRGIEIQAAPTELTIFVDNSTDRSSLLDSLFVKGFSQISWVCCKGDSLNRGLWLTGHHKMEQAPVLQYAFIYKLIF